MTEASDIVIRLDDKTGRVDATVSGKQEQVLDKLRRYEVLINGVPMFYSSVQLGERAQSAAVMGYRVAILDTVTGLLQAVQVSHG